VRIAGILIERQVRSMTSRSNHDDAPLIRRLQALAEAEARIETPPRVEAAVMAGWDAAHTSRARSRARGAVRGAAAAAAGLIVIGAVAVQQALDHPAVPALPASPDLAWAPASDPDRPAARAAVVQDAAAPSPAESAVLVLVGQPLVEGEPVRVVRMRVAGSTLAALGIRSLAIPQPESLDVDVLVGEDGVARALRLEL
jgi:hypothetical protein